MGDWDPNLALTSLAAGLTAICVYLHLRIFSYWTSRNIPGPTPWPIFGTNIYYILGNKLQVDAKWRQQYGKTYGLYEGYSPLLRTTDKDLIRDVFVRQHSSFTDRNNQFTYEEVQRNWLLWSEGADWATQRALVSPMFSSAKMRPWLAVMSDCFQRFKSHADGQLQEACAKTPAGIATSERPPVATFDKTELGCLLLELIGLSFFGLRVDTYADRANEFLVEARRVSELQLTRFLTWLFLPRCLARALAYELVPYDCYKYFDLLTKRIIEERRARGAKTTTPASKDFVQFFLDAKLPELGERVFNQDDDRDAHYAGRMGHEQLEQVQRSQASTARYKNFTDLQIRGHMTFMFVAGFETTAGTLGFCLYELAHKPQVQRVLLDELTEALGGPEGAREMARAGITNAQDKSSLDLLVGLQYLDAFVSEALRLYAPIIELNRRVTSRGGAIVSMEIGAGHATVPRTVSLDAGTPVSINPFVVQRDPDYFEAPDEFRLERFLPENRAKVASGTFMPFGLGPRHCVGMRYALLAIKLIIARTLLSYEISPGPKTSVYPPPGFQRNTVFLVPLATEFCLSPRNL